MASTRVALVWSVGTDSHLFAAHSRKLISSASRLISLQQTIRKSLERLWHSQHEAKSEGRLESHQLHSRYLPTIMEDCHVWAPESKRCFPLNRGSGASSRKPYRKPSFVRLSPLPLRLRHSTPKNTNTRSPESGSPQTPNPGARCLVGVVLTCRELQS